MIDWWKQKFKNIMTLLRYLRRGFKSFGSKLRSGTNIQGVIIRATRIRPEEECYIRDHVTRLIRGRESMHTLIVYRDLLHEQFEYKKDFNPLDKLKAREVAFLESQLKLLNHRIEQMQKCHR